MQSLQPLVTVALVLLALFGPLACSSSDSAQEFRTIRFPQALAETHPRVQALQRFAKRLENQTEGRLQVQIYPGGQLYGARQAVNATAFGDVEMSLEPESHFITFDENFKAIDIPFVFEGVEDFHNFLEGFEPLIRPSLEARGLVLIALWDEGPMIMASRQGALRTPDDLGGLKIRSSGHDLLARSWNEMGAATVRIPIHEVYTALQQGVADAIYTTFNTFVSGKIYEVAPKVVLWPSRAAYVWVASSAFWSTLPETEKETILQIASEVTDEYHQEIWDAYPQLVQTVRSAPQGEFTELSEAQLEAFRQKVEPLLRSWKTEFSHVLGQR